ncbi:MAG: PD-(D/E)XK motif protein [Chloroflexota bacterium]|nr:PD-(D/E)XK motif protein [Chloroflexota bacterium]
MARTGLLEIYEGIATPENEGMGTPLFAVQYVPKQTCYFIGKDTSGQPCLLVETKENGKHKLPPIHLESLDAQFELGCQITDPEGQIREGVFTVVRFRSLDLETIRYFLSVCQIIMVHLGDKPSRRALATAVRRLASIFKNIHKTPIRSLNGLFGELFVIWRSQYPARAVAAWRIEDTSRFDFAMGDIRLEVKSCAGRVRAHTFAYDQCNPPPRTHAVVASLLVERIPGGISLGDLINSIETQLAGVEPLALKFHEVIASTLGADLSSAMQVTFDARLTENSLQFFDLREIPALRGSLPHRVTNVHFTVDLSGLAPLSQESLIKRDPHFRELIPQLPTE